VDVALELIGLPAVMQQAVRSLAPCGRAALAGITDRPIEVSPYHELINREAEVIGVSDHLMAELPELLGFAARGALDLSAIVTRTVGLDAAAINGVLDELTQFRNSAVRTVVVPET
jgi:threonine dehydrogenase-like Zn-dependent dehydrogenase